MYRAIAGTLLALLSITACEHENNGLRAEVTNVLYQCENGGRLEFKYVVPDGEPGLGILTYHNAIIPMHQEPTASGTLYVADKGQPGYRWHVEGNKGILSRQPFGNGEAEILFRDCLSAN